VTALVTLDEIRAAHERVRDVVVRTPVHPSDALSEALGADVRLKLEGLQRTGSFKARGAYNFVAQVDPVDRARGVITYSSGNHAQATALAARLHGVPAVVVMPTDAPGVKRKGTQRLGAEVVFEGTTSLERKARAEAIQAERDLVMVPPFDHRWIIAGQGTAGLEIHEDWPEWETFVVCVGGGGLASGTSAALSRLKPDARIIAVEPEGAASMRAAWDAGGPVTLDTVQTIADGLRPVRTGDLTFAHVREFCDDVVTVDDASIREAARLLFRSQKLVVEWSGAATTAALLSGRISVRPGERVVALVSGSNADPSVLTELAND
jgi:threo-3-hydroxy-L-aspartate ammonia-lyase